MIKRNYIYLFTLFLLCVFSRIITSIYYIEDIDSLRFALSIQDYNILALQPHFPGYPVFCFVAKVLHYFIGNMGIVFSIIGGASVFTIIFYLLRIYNASLKTYGGRYITLIIFFNPLIWIMSNRYMPDLAGLAVALSIIYYLIFAEKENNHLEKGFFLTAMLIGIRLSYVPLILFPFCRILLRNKDTVRLALFFGLGVLLWLLPMITITGVNDLVLIGKRHTAGHFMDYGGTIFTEYSMVERVTHLFKSVWADGFGGYWLGRAWPTLILTILLLLQFGTSFKDLSKKSKLENKLKLLIYCVLIYTLWAFLFQNIIFKSRHVLPILLFFCILLIEGQKKIRSNVHLALVYIYFIVSAGHTFNLNYQHQQSTAVHKLKNYLTTQGQVDNIISAPLINYYLKRHMLQASFINIEESAQIESFINQDDSTESAIMIGDYHSLLGGQYSVIKDTTFFHNPYMNQMWPKIDVYNLNLHNKDD